jgi:hypothetical protein
MTNRERQIEYHATAQSTKEVIPREDVKNFTAEFLHLEDKIIVNNLSLSWLKDSLVSCHSV